MVPILSKATQQGATLEKVLVLLWYTTICPLKIWKVTSKSHYINALKIASKLHRSSVCRSLVNWYEVNAEYWACFPCSNFGEILYSSRTKTGTNWPMGTGSLPPVFWRVRPREQHIKCGGSVQMHVNSGSESTILSILSQGPIWLSPRNKQQALLGHHFGVFYSYRSQNNNWKILEIPGAVFLSLKEQVILDNVKRTPLCHPAGQAFPIWKKLETPGLLTWQVQTHQIWGYPLSAPGGACCLFPLPSSFIPFLFFSFPPFFYLLNPLIVWEVF